MIWKRIFTKEPGGAFSREAGGGGEGWGSGRVLCYDERDQADSEERCR